MLQPPSRQVNARSLTILRTRCRRIRLCRLSNDDWWQLVRLDRRSYRVLLFTIEIVKIFLQRLHHKHIHTLLTCIFCRCSQSLEQSTYRPQDCYLFNGRFKTALKDLALQKGLSLIYRLLVYYYNYFINVFTIIIIIIIILVIILSSTFYVMRHRSLHVL